MKRLKMSRSFSTCRWQNAGEPRRGEKTERKQANMEARDMKLRAGRRGGRRNAYEDEEVTRREQRKELGRSEQIRNDSVPE